MHAHASRSPSPPPPPPPPPPQGYRTNSPFTNHALLGLFRRLADPQQLNLEPMLYQVGWGGVCMHGVSMHGGVVMLLPGFGAG
jgi:hypothetical protein